MKRALISSLVIAALHVPSALAAEKACGSVVENRTVGRETASADVMANLVSSSGSLRKQSWKLLKQAEDASETSEPPDRACPASCGAKREIVLTSVPRKFLNDYPNREKCEAKLSQTGKEPFTVHDRTFSSLEDLYDWIKAFSQGKGEDGERLYTFCSGCSPQYTFIVDKGGEDRYVVDARVRCGHARDRDDNRYIAESGYRWICDPGDRTELQASR